MYRIQDTQERILQRMAKIEESLAGHSTSEAYKLVWPVSTRTQLEQIEDDLSRQNVRTRKALEKQFKRADRSGLYAFLQVNLGGLLIGTERWSWTGRPSQLKTYLDESVRSEKADDDEEAEDDEPTPSNSCKSDLLYSKSSPANSLKSVLLLHDVCYQLFEGVSEANIVQKTRHVLTNMNNAYQKRKMRAGNAVAQKRIR